MPAAADCGLRHSESEVYIVKSSAIEAAISDLTAHIGVPALALAFTFARLFKKTALKLSPQGCWFRSINGDRNYFAMTRAISRTLFE